MGIWRLILPHNLWIMLNDCACYGKAYCVFVTHKYAYVYALSVVYIILSMCKIEQYFNPLTTNDHYNGCTVNL